MHTPLYFEREVVGEGQKAVLVLVATGGERRDLVFRDLPTGLGLGLDLGLGSGLAAARAPTFGIGSVTTGNLFMRSHCMLSKAK